MRHRIQAYRFTAIEAFKEALQKTAEKHGATFRMDRSPKEYSEQLRVSATSKTITIHHPEPMAYFTNSLAFFLGVPPWMEVRIQESSHWDYSLERGNQLLDDFSTYPQYWEEEEDPITLLATRGNPEMLSLVFGVPVEKFERYLRHWYSDWDEEAECYRNKLKGKAYPADQWNYGNYEQFWDFLPSIGIQDPCAKDAEAFVWELKLPERPATRRAPMPKQSWWRRLTNR